MPKSGDFKKELASVVILAKEIEKKMSTLSDKVKELETKVGEGDAAEDAAVAQMVALYQALLTQQADAADLTNRIQAVIDSREAQRAKLVAATSENVVPVVP